MGAQLLTGLARAGVGVRAVAPITAAALEAGAGWAGAAPIDVTWFAVPYLESSRDAVGEVRYRRHEAARFREVIPALVRQRRPDVLLVARESYAWHIPTLKATVHVPCALIVQFGRRFLLATGSTREGQRLLRRFAAADLVITVAAHLAGRLRELGLGRLRVIPNPVDLDLFRPRPRSAALARRLRVSDDERVVLHVSKLSSIKRPLDVVASAAIALARDRRLVYVVVGDGPCRGQLEDACAAFGIADRFRFTGWIDHALVPEYLGLADVMVLPSAAEGQALVCLEAQACGCVVLASDISAAREIVEDGVTGLLFRTADVEELAARTLQVVGDPELRSRIRRAAERAVRAHALERVVTEYRAALGEVAIGRPVLSRLDVPE